MSRSSIVVPWWAAATPRWVHGRPKLRAGRALKATRNHQLMLAAFGGQQCNHVAGRKSR